MFGFVAALLFTAGALLLCLKWLGRLHGGRPRAGRAATLQVLERVSTGPRQGVVLLRAGERVMVVGVGDGHTTLLGELDGEDRAGVLDAAPSAPAFPSLGGLLSWRTPLRKALLGLALIVAPMAVQAQEPTSPPPAARTAAGPSAAAGRGPSVTPPAPPRVEVRMGDGANELKLSGAVGVVVFMGALTLLPALFLLTTSFTRILVVLHFLRSAIGTQTAPPTQLLVALAVMLTGVIMGPVLNRANTEAVQPYLAGDIGQVEAYQRAMVPLREFMLSNTRTQDVATFAEIGGQTEAESLEELPTPTIVSAFVVSELRTAFQMGFVIFLPFLVIDLIVASVLMSMGMFMLPPVMVSLPFKLLLFVLADGWSLVVQSLVASFRG